MTTKLEEQMEVAVAHLVEEVTAITVADDDDYEICGAMLKAIKAKKKEIDEAFDPIIEAAHKAHKAAIAQKKKYVAPLDDAQEKLKAGVIGYASGYEDEDDHINAETVEIDGMTVYVAPDVELPEISGLHFRESWTFEIVDEGEIPRKYLKPDSTKIGKVVRALKEQTDIPGIIAKRKKTVVVR